MTIEKAEAELYPPLAATAGRIADAFRERALAQANSSDVTTLRCGRLPMT